MKVRRKSSRSGPVEPRVVHGRARRKVVVPSALSRTTECRAGRHLDIIEIKNGGTGTISLGQVGNNQKPVNGPGGGGKPRNPGGDLFPINPQIDHTCVDIEIRLYCMPNAGSF